MRRGCHKLNKSFLQLDSSNDRAQRLFYVDLLRVYKTINTVLFSNFLLKTDLGYKLGKYGEM